MEAKPQISFVVPLYNEESVLPELKSRLDLLMEKSKLIFEIVLVNDGSKDNTEKLIRQYGLDDKRYQVVSLSRNFGHQYAVSAGLKLANANEAIMVIDGDLQDPPELVFEFYEKYKEGFDVVYGIRKKRKESALKKICYKYFYRFLKSISVIEMPLDSGDFSLMGRKVVDHLNQMPEESRYIRGLRAWVGFNQTGLEYERQGRHSGDSKYSFKSLVRLAYNGIFNFSVFPIKMITRLGFVTTLLGLIYLVYTIIRKIYFNDVPQGFTSLLIAIILFSGVQLLSLGIIGEYVTRIFMQSKERPL
jgi:dolichol-phosphate mannosyltransferase